MNTTRRLMTAIFCALTLLANGTTGALAQTQQRERQPAPPPPPHEDVLINPHGLPLPPPGAPANREFFSMQIAPPAPGESFGFSFLSSEMHFDSKVVKGVPYSAEAVTESVQSLADGNRVTRKSTAMLYRDSEGRTRREQTLNHVGPWASADDPPQTIFINDPVAGANYMLNPRNRTAQKMNNAFVFTRTPEEGQGTTGVIAPAPGAARTQIFLREGSRDGHNAVTVTAAPMKAPAMGNRLANQAVKRVPPVYPAVAKAAGAQGPVTVEIVINEAGEVASAKAVSGHPLLQSAAVDAAKEWRFAPTKLSGEAVKVTGKISFVFALPKDDNSASVTEVQSVRVMTNDGVEGRHMRMPAAPPVTETLGKQTIEGVEAEGTRTTVTLPAGLIGNERPINIVSERWYSPELQIVVMTKQSDPRFGETTYRLTSINRTEPARNLFEVPADYTLKTERSFPRQFRMKRENNE